METNIPEKKVNSLALAGFITSIVGLVIAIGPIVGIILSAIGLSKINKQPDIYKGKGYAIAGLIIGIVLVLGVIVYAIFEGLGYWY